MPVRQRSRRRSRKKTPEVIGHCNRQRLHLTEPPVARSIAVDIWKWRRLWRGWSFQLSPVREEAGDPKHGVCKTIQLIAGGIPPSTRAALRESPNGELLEMAAVHAIEVLLAGGWLQLRIAMQVDGGTVAWCAGGPALPDGGRLLTGR